MERQTITDLYLRTCKDSGYALPFDMATQIVARVLGIIPLEVGLALGSLDNMKAVAAGTHPACKNEKARS